MSMAIADYPVLNSSLSADESSLTFHGRHNIGIAMDTPRGLLVTDTACRRSGLWCSKRGNWRGGVGTASRNARF